MRGCTNRTLFSPWSSCQLVAFRYRSQSPSPVVATRTQHTALGGVVEPSPGQKRGLEMLFLYTQGYGLWRCARCRLRHSSHSPVTVLPAAVGPPTGPSQYHHDHGYITHPRPATARICLSSPSRVLRSVFCSLDHSSLLLLISLQFLIFPGLAANCAKRLGDV